jgi:hypothetical protein
VTIEAAILLELSRCGWRVHPDVLVSRVGRFLLAGETAIRATLDRLIREGRIRFDS